MILASVNFPNMYFQAKLDTKKRLLGSEQFYTMFSIHYEHISFTFYIDPTRAKRILKYASIARLLFIENWSLILSFTYKVSSETALFRIF